MITAILAAFVIWCLMQGAVPLAVQIAVSVAIGVVFLVFGRHNHNDVLTIDILARRSRFAAENAALKVWGTLLLLVLCVCSQSLWPPLVLFLVLAALSTGVGGTSLNEYFSLFRLLAVFLLLSGLALLWDFSHSPIGIWNIPCFGGYLTMTAAAQSSARIVLARSLGAVSCLYFLSLSTPMPEILAVLRKAHVPSVMIELAILIYRYIFILLSTYRNRRDAAASRLGFGSLRQRIRTMGCLYGNLLASSFKKAGACFDAMESRCYMGEIRFLSKRKPVTVFGAVLFGVLLVGTAVLVVLID